MNITKKVNSIKTKYLKSVLNAISSSNLPDEDKQILKDSIENIFQVLEKTDFKKVDF